MKSSRFGHVLGYIYICTYCVSDGYNAKCTLAITKAAFSGVIVEKISEPRP